MIVIGLTGSIGMGKSTAASMLRRLGLPVHDSDKAVHQALQKGPAAVAVARIFPKALHGGKIDRKALGEIVFKDKAALTQLEEILHPAAQASQKKFLCAARLKGHRAVVLEIPLLFETGADERVDFVVSVTASPAIQRRRVLARRNMTEEKFKRILESQMPDLEKRRRSDFVVQTGMGKAVTFRALRVIMRRILQKGVQHA